MPEMMNLPQPHHTMLMPRPVKESPRHAYGFPEYLKHTDALGDGIHPLKLTASNSLFHSVLKGRVRGTRLLLDRGTSVNGRNDYGYSVLTAALHVDDDKRRGKLFKMLIDSGADPHFKDSTFNRSVLHWTCILGRTEQIKVLLNEVGGDLNLQDKDNDSYTALHHAVMAGHITIVTLLVDMHRKFGISVDVPDKMGLTPYLHAKRLGYRDVAEYLHTEGHASLGHGDMKFRLPREWSQIGRFERQKAIEIQTQEVINFAKIKGKITHVRHMEGSMGSPRMCIPNIILPSYCPDRDRGIKLAIRHNNRMSRSLPSLKEDTPRADHRPLSANGAGHDSLDAGANHPTDAPGPAREAFTNGPIHSHGVPQMSTHARALSSVPEDPIQGLPQGTPRGAPMADGILLPSPRKGPGSIEAFTVMEMNQKGRHARHYRQSQFDETKASEYKHMLGNLNSIMQILSEQTSKSFRQSVKYQRPETPKKKKQKKKVSSLAVIFGRNKSGTKGSKRSPKASAKKGAQHLATPRKEKGGGGGKAGGGKGGDEKHSKAQPSEKRKAVPLLKVNDKIVG
ncbi:uncharacterized protein [Littorina saxatilis]|uniref:Uncharacterized protein n=1 Tax=Littorina saxatilis TaxID=31220 RepID=A0AAN9BUK7_9CAEN